VPLEHHADKGASLTGDRILDTAERLFAENGLERVSIRDITAAAGANVGAINYYFGSKEGLVFAVFNRRLTPITEERLAALDQVEKAAGEAALQVEDVLRAFIRPVVAHALDPKWGSASFSKLMGRLVGEPGTTAGKLKAAHFDRLAARFDPAILRAVPGLSPEELHWRMRFIVGALHYMLITMDPAHPCWPGDEPDCDRQVRRLVAFAAAGLGAP
jgi:AcrR family transcriptional regulator